MNTADEEAQMERDEWASREVMPITNWGRRPDGSEIVQYDAPMFFSFTKHSLLHQYPHMRAECHWHVDLELTYIIHGHMWYFVNGETVRLDEGQAIFVNSRQLHYGFTQDVPIANSPARCSIRLKCAPHSKCTTVSSRR